MNPDPRLDDGSAPERPSGKPSVEDVIVGGDPRILAAKDLARRVARTSVPVLIVGETGTGKELLAHYIHGHSGRPGHLVDVDCGALPDDLIEGLLFGHRRGAFTGAVNHSRGLIAEADQGTLLLDELSSMPIRGQAKLLRVLETGRVRRVGDARAREVTFRVVATAQRSLSRQVAEGLFRADLAQRVAGVVIELPSLAQRVDDVPALVAHFAGLRGLTVEKTAVDFLASQPWPGNVRQLKWTITRCGFFAEDGAVGLSAVQGALETGLSVLTQPPSAHPGSSARELVSLCRKYRGDGDRIAEAMGVGRATMYRRLREHGLSLRRFRGVEASG